MRTGAACLILVAGRFRSPTVTVAIVENQECSLRFESMAAAADVAWYGSGRLSGLASRWVGSPELSACRFVHCGDHDPVGLDEFLRRKDVLGNRVRLHRPPHLRELLTTFGRPDLLRDSAPVARRLRSSAYPDVRFVARPLDDTGCGLDQECLLIDRPDGGGGGT